MRKCQAFGIVAIAIGVVVVAYLSQSETVEAPEASGSIRRDGEASAFDSKSTLPDPNDSTSQTQVASMDAAPDPRLEVFRVSPDNGLIGFVTGDNGQIIQEIDKDPNSFGYGKSAREYLYAGDRVVGLTAYQYLGYTVQVTKTMVAYDSDGSVRDFQESTTFMEPEKPSKR